MTKEKDLTAAFYDNMKSGVEYSDDPRPVSVDALRARKRAIREGRLKAIPADVIRAEEAEKEAAKEAERYAEAMAAKAPAETDPEADQETDSKTKPVTDSETDPATDPETDPDILAAKAAAEQRGRVIYPSAETGANPETDPGE